MQTYYFQMPGGSVRKVESDGQDPVETPDGATVLTAEQYAARLAEIEAAEAERIATEAAAEQTAAQSDYEALLAAGIPEATARRLSGYEPPDDVSEGLTEREA